MQKIHLLASASIASLFLSSLAVSPALAHDKHHNHGLFEAEQQSVEQAVKAAEEAAKDRDDDAYLAQVSANAAQLKASGKIAFTSPVTEADMRREIAILASDDFEGRNPGTMGENKTIKYIADKWAGFGLVSGTNDPANPWYQPVALVDRKPGDAMAIFTQKNGKIYTQMGDASFEAKGLGKKNRISLDDNLILIGRDADNLATGDMVFVGYGVNEQGKVTQNVKGKIAIVLFDQPEFASDETGDNQFPDRRERVRLLSEAGASAVIVRAPDSFPWGRVRRSIKSGNITLADRDAPVAVSGYTNGGFLDKLLKNSGSDSETAMEAASNPEFAGLDLGLSAEIRAQAQVRNFTSHNVIGKIPGKNTGNSKDAVLMLGHWDHFGYCAPGEEDEICNGAVDNASGIAALINIAENMAKDPQNDRDIYFMATTAEERGLLGAYYYADHPNIPLDNIVVALNMDTIAIAPSGTSVAMVGRGTNDLDVIVDTIATAMGRDVNLSLEANAFIHRQDGWALTAKGVKSIMAGGSFSNMKLLEDYLSGPYHGVDDELTDDVPLGGSAEDANLHIALAEYFANSGLYPNDGE